MNCRSVFSALLFCAASVTAWAQVTVTTDKPSGVYDSAKDKQIVFQVTSAKPGVPLCAEVRINDGEIVKMTPDKDGRVVVKPQEGWTFVTAYELNDKGKRTGRAGTAGALVDLESIQPGAPDPADFDEFWAGEIAAMNKIPLKPELEEVEITNPKYQGQVRAWKYKLDCGNGNYAYGYIAMPMKAEKGSLPAIAQFHGASTMGVRSPAIYYAKHSINLVMSPHMTECGRDPKYYSQMQKEHISGYTTRNADDRNLYYMKGMALRVLRSLQLIESMPEWNGKDLITHGESQGGYQAIVGAALDPKVSFCLAMVPAMSDHLGYLRGHLNGWPYVIKPGRKGQEEFNEKAAKAMPYYDNANFARRIHCQTWLSTGLLDTTCPPTGVAAVYNSLPKDTEKHFFIAPKAGHGAGNADVVPTLHKIVIPGE